MDIELSKETLLPGLSAAAAITSRKIPILETIRVSVAEGNIILTSTDIERQIEIDIEGSSVIIEPGSVCVPAKKWLDIIKLLPDEANVRIKKSGGSVSLASASGRYSLSTLPPEEFPAFDSGSANCVVAIQPGLLLGLIQQAAYAIAVNDSRFVLCGLFFKIEGDRMTVAASDGHRLATAWATLASGWPPGDPVSFIVPKSGVAELSKVLAALPPEADPVRVSTSPQSVCFHLYGHGIRLSTKLIDGIYPDYVRVLPKITPIRFSANRQDLRAAISRVSVISSDKFRGIKLEGDGTNLKISSRTEHESASENLLIVDSGSGSTPDFSIGFNANYLIDALSRCRGTAVMIGLTAELTSALITDMDHDWFQHVIMPMRL